jgi:TolB protein
MVTDTLPTSVYSDIFTMHADGTAQARLTLTPQSEYFGPSWSPDGRKIAFALGPGSKPTSLYLMNADGTNLIQLTHLSLTCYLQQWSPDGSKLVFIGQQGKDVNTAAVYGINADGSNARRLTHEDAREYGASWSPDGRHIAFGSLQGGVWHIFLMNADGSEVRRLTSMSGNKPTWSPDGRFIAFTSDVTGHDDLYVMNADGSHVHLLMAYGDHAAWSPDGQHIAFESNRTGNEEIYSMNSDGSGVTNLTRNPGVENQLPAWSPDSREITYMTQRQPFLLHGELMQSLGIASILIQAALLVGAILLLQQRWRLPFGAWTLVLFLNGLLLAVLAGQYVLLSAAFFTGLVADGLCWRLHPTARQPVRYALVAGAVPVVWSGLYFLTLSLTQGISWSLPLWTGTILLAGLVGLLLSSVLGLLQDRGAVL